MDSWYRILRPHILRLKKKSIDDFIPSTHITAKQFNQEIKAAFAFMQSHLIFETVLVATLHPKPTPRPKHIWSELLKEISCPLWLQLLSLWKLHHGLLSAIFNNLQLQERRGPSHDSKYNKIFAMDLGCLPVTLYDCNTSHFRRGYRKRHKFLMCEFNTTQNLVRQ